MCLRFDSTQIIFKVIKMQKLGTGRISIWLFFYAITPLIIRKIAIKARMITTQIRIKTAFGFWYLSLAIILVYWKLKYKWQALGQ